MTTDRWQRIEALYHEMLVHPTHERAAALAAACPDDEALRAEVQSLLDQPGSAAGFLAAPVLLEAVADSPAPGALLAGMRIGVFVIDRLLGVGGMGEVYRARDTRLGRDVAIKVLSRKFTAESDGATRLQREARLLAALNHPHIGAVYGLEEINDAAALVMELVDGEDLSQRIARGAVPVGEALTIARQIAEALEAAHETGIVHRDLKPANIKVRPDGTVKVLDFGLAKALALGDSRASAIRADAGLIVGTPAYMSPEQVRGEAASRHADIWSFGVVLYELLTGLSPFARDTVTETLASVLGTVPDYSRLPADTPAPIRHLLRRCLERDRKRRLQHVGDGRIEIEEAIAAAASDAETPRTASGAHGRRWRAAGIAALAGVSLVIVAGLAALWTNRFAPSSSAVVHLSIPAVEPPFVEPYGARHLAISRDGSRVAFTSASRIWIRRMDRPDAVAIDAVAASSPFFSADGEWLAFFGQSGGQTGLKKVPVAGGTPVLLVASGERPGGGVWLADGTIVFATSTGLHQVSENGGDTRLLAQPDRNRMERVYAWPQSLPDGRSLLFTMVPEGSIDGAQIVRLDLKTLHTTVVMKAASAAQYTSTGHLVYAAGRTLRAAQFDASSAQIRSESFSLPDIEIATAPDNGAVDFAISDTGTLVFIPPTAPLAQSRTVSWIDRRGNEERLPIPPGRYEYARISPDGTRVALDIPGANRDIWIWSLERRTLTRLTSGPTEDLVPVWSPDGRRVYFASDRAGTFDIYSQAADGATAARLEFSGPGSQMPSIFTPDGTRLLVVENFKDISVLDLATQRLEPLLHSEFAEWFGSVSPDGRWIAYESNEAGERTEVFLRPFPDIGGQREKVSIDGGRYPMWSSRGSELFYLDLNGGLMAAALKLWPSVSLGSVTKLFDSERPPRGISGRLFDVSPLDGRFLVIKSAVPIASRGIDISVVLNWFRELRERVPRQ